ncbi:MAG: poly-gamma-glutamate hydrolase family protein [Chromatiales bacterium]
MHQPFPLLYHARVDTYRNYEELSRGEREGHDFRVTIREVPDSPIAIVAPHGGGIERGTSQIASAIAGQRFNLYLFEGLKPRKNFDILHITSRRFDEPRCMALVARAETVITVHGCVGLDERVYIGGLDHALKARIASALVAHGVDGRLDGHPFPAHDPGNICNRGRRGRGVQLEFTVGLRRTRPSAIIGPLIRGVLLGLSDRSVPPRP